MESKFNSKKRFSTRVNDYLKYRPKYPKEIINFLQKEFKFDSTSVIADIGSGTGFLSELFLENGNLVFGVEPNNEMREVGDLYLDFPNFRSINGSAEETTLDSKSIDIIIAGQAYHWFDPKKSKIEFVRILKDNNIMNCVLIWNTRDISNSEFGRDLEIIIENFSTDYLEVRHNRKKADLSKPTFTFFEDSQFARKAFLNFQELNFSGLLGRLLSSSYMIDSSNTNFPILKKDLRLIFDKYKKNGKIEIIYNTEVYYGQLK